MDDRGAAPGRGGVAAGDCYDLVRLRGGGLGLIVVDIAGHGATEGILALRCKELLRASLAADVSPGEAIEAAAEQLGEMGPEVFLTAFVAVVDTETDASAMRTPGIRLRSSARKTAISTSTRRARSLARCSGRPLALGNEHRDAWSRATTSVSTPTG